MQDLLARDGEQAGEDAFGQAGAENDDLHTPSPIRQLTRTGGRMEGGEKGVRRILRPCYCVDWERVEV
jgi:hypothetical protein